MTTIDETVKFILDKNKLAFKKMVKELTPNQTEDKLYVIKPGYDHDHDHYFHDDHQEWAELGCPICKILIERQV